MNGLGSERMEAPLSLPFSLARNAAGRLVLTSADAQVHEGVTPVRAFPLSGPDDGLSLVGPDGHELAWVERISTLPDDVRTLLEQDLALRDFAPRIQRLADVSSFATPSTWAVETDRGPARLLLKAEEDIRRLPGGGLLITDGHGLHFRIDDLGTLDKASRRMLDRFLA